MDGHAEELELIAGRFERLRSAGGAAPRRGPGAEPARQAGGLGVGRACPGVARRRAARGSPSSGLRFRIRLFRVRFLFTSPAQYARFRLSVLRLRRLRFQIAFYGGLRNLLRNWRVMHASLAVFLVFVMTVHIGVSLYLGYGLQ